MTRFGAYHPPGVEESRTLLSEGVVGFRLVFSGSVRFGTHLFLRIQVLFQHLCFQYIGTAIMCVLQVYSTCVCSTVVRHMCVQYSGTAPVCAVQWYNTCVQYSKGVLARRDLHSKSLDFGRIV